MVVVVVVVLVVVVVICENTSTCFSVVGTSGGRTRAGGVGGRGGRGGRGDLRKHINLLQWCGYFRKSSWSWSSWSWWSW